MNKADKDYFLDDDLNLTDDEAKGAFLLVRKGQEIAASIQEKHFSKKKEKKAEAESNKAKSAPENKGKK